MNTQSKKLYITRTGRSYFIVFGKNCTQENVKSDIQYEDEQVSYKYLYFPPEEITPSHFQTLFGRRNRDAF